MRARAIRQLTAAAIAGACMACVAAPISTRPDLGTRVVIDFSPSRHLDVPMADSSTLAYDDVTSVDGRVERMNGDTVWLRDIGVKVQGEWSWPNPRKPLAVPGVNRSATIYRAPQLVTVGVIAVGAAIVLGALLIGQWLVGSHGPGL